MSVSALSRSIFLASRCSSRYDLSISTSRSPFLTYEPFSMTFMLFGSPRLPRPEPGSPRLLWEGHLAASWIQTPQASSDCGASQMAPCPGVFKHSGRKVESRPERKASPGESSQTSHGLSDVQNDGRLRFGKAIIAIK